MNMLISLKFINCYIYHSIIIVLIRIYLQCLWHTFLLGLKALSSTSLNLKRLVNETTAKEPILIIISPGSDPSQVSVTNYI